MAQCTIEQQRARGEESAFISETTTLELQVRESDPDMLMFLLCAWDRELEGARRMNGSATDAVKKKNKQDERRRQERAFPSVTLPAPGHQWLRLALSHTLHHSWTAENDCCILRWRNNRNSVQGFCRSCNNKTSVHIGNTHQWILEKSGIAAGKFPVWSHWLDEKCYLAGPDFWIAAHASSFFSNPNTSSFTNEVKQNSDSVWLLWHGAIPFLTNYCWSFSKYSWHANTTGRVLLKSLHALLGVATDCLCVLRACVVNKRLMIND